MILVVVEHENGTIPGTTAEALTFARGLDPDLHGVAFGEGAVEALTAARTYGVGAATQVTIGDGYAPAAWAQAIVDLSSPAVAVVAAGTDRGSELLAHVATKASVPFVANCVSAEPGADGWSVTRQRWGGSLLEDAAVSASLVAMSVALHVVEPAPAVDPARGPPRRSALRRRTTTCAFARPSSTPRTTTRSRSPRRAS